jgi:glycerophosphoryl diester phosphodiesterase
MVWTVNRSERMREFSEWGVDAIISDETELLVSTLR